MDYVDDGILKIKPSMLNVCAKYTPLRNDSQIEHVQNWRLKPTRESAQVLTNLNLLFSMNNSILSDSQDLLNANVNNNVMLNIGLFESSVTYKNILTLVQIYKVLNLF